MYSLHIVQSIVRETHLFDLSFVLIAHRFAHLVFRSALSWLFSCSISGRSFQGKSGTRSRGIRSRIGRQSVGRTLRGLLLSRRSLPFKPPPVLTLPPAPRDPRSPDPTIVPRRISSRPRGFSLCLSIFFLSVFLFPLHPWEKPALTLLGR